MTRKRKHYPEYCGPAPLCRIYDLSPSGLRYLEEKGLIEPERDPENGYRTYAMTEFTRLFLHRTWRQYGFTADESIDLILRTGPQAQADAFLRRERAIDEEIRLLAAQKRRLCETRDALMRLVAGESPSVAERPPLLRLSLIPNHRHTLYENVEEFRRWYDALPLTSASMLLQTDAEDRVASVSLGFLAKPEDAAMLGLSDSPHAAPLPPVPCLAAEIRIRDDLEDLEEKLLPLFREIRARGLEPAGPAVTSLLTMVKTGNTLQRVDRIWIPVKKGEASISKKAFPFGEGGSLKG